ncbi:MULTISPECIES: maleylpyruvate isomerase family mycothiol-dependent enzyme [unclassified Brachybacterium]|uniref:maleylpyruvate isomerase family mycothiol-dependent enzyme n=1 Tax=unclassified Brachybacterium TaxID=2623841 RepID=UPI003607A494
MDRRRDDVLAREHAALTEDLQALSREQWAQGSLCAGWTVHDVVAHLGAVLTGGWTSWAAHMLRAGLRPEVYNRRRISRFAGPTPEETLSRFAAIGSRHGEAMRPATRRTVPWLGEVIVHAQDIRRPLGLERTPEQDSVLAVATFFASRDYTVRSRSQVRGLHLRATDASFAHNPPELPAVRGPLLALVMVMAGRPAYLEDLAGSGVATLRRRMTR